MNRIVEIEGYDELLHVSECYAYGYDYGDGKTVLRIVLPYESFDMEQIEEIFSQNHHIRCYQGELDSANVLDFYNFYGNIDIKIENDICTIEIEQKTDAEITTERIENELNDAMEALVALYEES